MNRKKLTDAVTRVLMQRAAAIPEGYTLVSRAVSVEPAGEGKPIRVVLSTDAPLPGRRARREVLVHTPDAVDMSRAQRGLPITAGHFVPGDVHDARLPVARAMNPRLEDGRLVGDLVVSAAHPELRADIESGVVTDLSVDALIDETQWRDDDDGTSYAQRWMPISAAFTLHGRDMGAVPLIEQRGDDLPKPKPAESRNVILQRMFAGLDGAEFVTMQRDAMLSEDPIETVQRKLNELVASKLSGPSPGAPRYEAGEDSLDKWCGAVQRALDFRCDLLTPEERQAYQRSVHGDEVASMSLREMARDYLRRRNEAPGGSPEQMVQRALELPAVIAQRAIFSHATSDFSNLLAGISDKALGKGFMEAEETYQRFAANVTMSNFLSHSFTALSTFGDLDEIPESGEFEYGTFSDKAETLLLKSYGKLFSINRHAIINDNLGAFTRVPMHMGRAAARQVGDLVYAVITGNPTMAETGRALWNTTDNTLASSGAALSVAALDLGHTAIGLFTDPAGNVLNLSPRYLLVPRARRTTAKVLIAAERNPAEGATTSFTEPNPFQDEFEVVSDARLDADSATAWYMLVGQNSGVDTISVGWLNGVQRPRLEQKAGFEVDGIAYKVAIDCTAGALDKRCGWKNPGA